MVWYCCLYRAPKCLVLTPPLLEVGGMSQCFKESAILFMQLLKHNETIS